MTGDNPANHDDLADRETSVQASPASHLPLDWRRAHEELSQLAKSRARLDWQEGHSLLYALRSGAHAALGFASFAEYIERLLGYGARWTAERLRVAEALERLPHLDQALRDAGITWSAARELTRVAVRENEHQWLEVSQGRTLREVEELVSGHRSGDAPGEPTGTSSPMHILRHEVSAETFATFREAVAKLRRDAGEPLDEDSVLLLICCAHHRAAHRGALTISGRVSTGLSFRHADGARYGATVDPRFVDAQVQAFRALRALGFREGETRRALDRVRAQPHEEDTSVEHVIRKTLAALTPPAVRSPAS